MATVYIGSARSDERGKANSGKAGDQKSGKEVSKQAWYEHKYGWRVIRAKDPAQAAKLAKAMKAACDNNKIGYDQYERNDLYDLAKKVGFDCSKVTTACETDCSALVRVCCAYAGITVGNFNTANQASKMLATGAFIELTASKYTTKSAYLRAGDCLVSRKKGHTVIVLNDGDKAEKNVPPVTGYELGDRTLENGMEGSDVKELQLALIDLGYSCGKWGADGDFGDSTENAVEAFQKAKKLTVDGVYGPKSHAEMVKALAALDSPVDEPRYVRITGGNCYVRTAPNTSGKKLGIVRSGDRLKYDGQTYENGWHLVEYGNQNGWVSGKYGKLEG